MQERRAWPCRQVLREPVFLWALFLPLTLNLSAPFVGHAQVTTNITSSGLNTTINQVGNSYNITGGTRPQGGHNLFHSFGDFSIGVGDIGNFLNDSSLATSNILGRVTGGNISNIYGTIQTTGFGSANLFLINPFGVVLGPNASLNVGGSVSFTNAQYIRLFDGLGNAYFYANPANDGLANSILTIDPAAFQFLNANPAGYGFLTAPDPSATITVQGSALSVPSGQSISLVGGKVIIESGVPDGGIAQPAQLSAPNGRILLATAAAPGEFTGLPGQSLTNATILRSVPNRDNASFTSIGTVSLASQSSMNVSGESSVWIKGGQLVLSVKDAILNTTGSAAPGDTIALGPRSSIVTSNSGSDPGAEVQIKTGTLQMDRSSISSTTTGSGRGGDVQVTAENLIMADLATIATTTRSGNGVGGNLILNVGTLSLAGGASGASVIRSTNNNNGIDLNGDGVADVTGVGGNITIRGIQGAGSAADNVLLSGEAQIASRTEGKTGNSGDISITTNSLGLSEASSINSASLGLGRSANIALSVQEASLSGGATISSRAETTSATGGKITLHGLDGDESMADSLTLTGLATGIKTGTTGTGHLGDIELRAKTVSLTDGAVIEVGTQFDNGTPGNIKILANSINISGGSSIASRTFAEDAGHVDITANQFSLNHASIETNTASFIGGRGGDVVLNVGSANLINGSSINSSSTGTGNAGNITINSKSSVTLQNSSITTEASQASGGQVTINAPDMVELVNSKIATSVQGSDADTAGGNISIDPQFVILNGSQILATANAGSGGNISIVSNVFLSSANSIVDASSQLGVSGTIDIRSPVSNLSSVVGRLPESLQAVQVLLRAACAAKLAQGQTSSFVERGRDSIPLGPDGLLASPYLPPTGEPSQLGAMPMGSGVGSAVERSGIQLRRLWGKDGSPSIKILSEDAACAT